MNINNNPICQSDNYISFICILFIKCLAVLFPEKKCYKTKKWINKKKNKSNVPDSNNEYEQ